MRTILASTIAPAAITTCGINSGGRLTKFAARGAIGGNHA